MELQKCYETKKSFLVEEIAINYCHFYLNNVNHLSQKIRIQGGFNVLFFADIVNSELDCNVKRVGTSNRIVS